jgi:hypothetical protein
MESLILAHWKGCERAGGGMGCVRPGQHSQRGGELGDKTNILRNDKYFEQFYKFKITEFESQQIIEIFLKLIISVRGGHCDYC